MEFTKENIIKLLTEVKDTMKKCSEEHLLKSEEFSKHKGLYDWFEGKAQAFDSCSNYLADTIDLIQKYYKTTEDIIDKENRKWKKLKES